MGFTPSLVTGCWVGGEERDIHFDNMTDGQGAAMALPIWGLYMKKVFADESLPYSQDETFDIPEDFDPCGSSLLMYNNSDSEREENSETEQVEEEGFDDLFQ